jgi:formylglycine-generating enzyme required for sulfatase activity
MVCLAAFVAALGSAASAADIATVPVGNAGNSVDSTPYGRFGRVENEYSIGKYEVTAGQYGDFLNKVAGVDAYDLYYTTMSRTDFGSGISRAGGGTAGDPYTYAVDPAFVNRPVNYVNWGDSIRFANWLTNGQPTGLLTGDPDDDAGLTEDGSYDLNGAMSDAELLAVSVPDATQRAAWVGGSKPYYLLPSDDEWYKAAYYNPGTDSYFDYPTSSDTAPGRDMDDASGNNANIYGDPYPIDSGKHTTLVGEFQNSESPYGTFDQGGNVWEWTETFHYTSYRRLRGGSLYDDDSFLLASFRLNISPSERSYDIGFRVSKVPEPATMAILVLGGIGILRRRRKQ